MRVAYSGSFDPFTSGHKSIVENLLNRDSSIYIDIIIGDNPNKTYLFSPEQRKEFIEIELADYKKQVHVIIYDGVIANYVYEQNIPFIIRGIRNNNSDVNDELNLARMNSTLNGEPLTLLIPQPDPSLDIVSSSNLKMLNKLGLALNDYASANIREHLRRKLTGKVLVGVTGGMACGKSTLCKQLGSFSNIYHINMDLLGHDIYDNSAPVYKNLQQHIIKYFKLTDKNLINRKELGDIVFKDPVKLKYLNNLLLEPILHLLYKKLHELPRGDAIVLIESAILVDLDLTEIVDHNIIHVTCDSHVQYDRLRKRKLTPKQITDRIISQLTDGYVDLKIKAIQQKEHDRLYLNVDTSDVSIDGVYKIDNLLLERLNKG